jgi:hypothetical protein
VLNAEITESVQQPLEFASGEKQKLLSAIIVICSITWNLYFHLTSQGIL